ncbi:MAG: hypothetical protein ABIH77_06070 [Pseudomonadota bacterium]|nr:hypothetical protein [Gammaproteobacteria bacterium]MBU1628885.1 hypothetical protein [Gammaproteobacteria bacterium]MBU1927234.1 hypothetical protein [Gammaproteobacteria bacterium]MBU2545691.1 hypothetical protein [Gammaproteobacteria bacterium]
MLSPRKKTNPANELQRTWLTLMAALKDPENFNLQTKTKSNDPQVTINIKIDSSPLKIKHSVGTRAHIFSWEFNCSCDPFSEIVGLITLITSKGLDKYLNTNRTLEAVLLWAKTAQQKKSPTNKSLTNNCTIKFR